MFVISFVASTTAVHLYHSATHDGFISISPHDPLYDQPLNGRRAVALAPRFDRWETAVQNIDIAQVVVDHGSVYHDIERKLYRRLVFYIGLRLPLQVEAAAETAHDGDIVESFS